MIVFILYVYTLRLIQFTSFLPIGSAVIKSVTIWMTCVFSAASLRKST